MTIVAKPVKVTVTKPTTTPVATVKVPGIPGSGGPTTVDGGTF